MIEFRQLVVLLAVLPPLVVVAAMLITARSAVLLRREHGRPLETLVILKAMIGRHDQSPALLKFARRMRFVWALFASQVLYLLAIILTWVLR